MRLSVLNGNLIVKFTDYLTGRPFYSFLGNNNPNETAEKLLKFSTSEGKKAQLKLIPEESTHGIDLEKFELKEDRDHFDYIYNLEELKSMQGGKFARKRNQVSLFLKNHPTATAKIFDLKDKNLQGHIINLFLEWLKIKKDKEEVFESHEEVAVSRLLLATDICRLVGIGVFIEEKLIGFFIDELTDSNYVVAHASKTDKVFAGVNSFLVRENALLLLSFSKELFNFEQDLGMANLRDAKTRFRPVKFLKKYKLTLR